MSAVSPRSKFMVALKAYIGRSLPRVTEFKRAYVFLIGDQVSCGDDWTSQSATCHPKRNS
ncbi:hypothetical protein MTBLM5_30216 [Magnetospirillum sp. LM-5]|nr:hypothetical protein MTBLM5_30216 [Magnetospirillum sp. LM-5]